MLGVQSVGATCDKTIWGMGFKLMSERIKNYTCSLGEDPRMSAYRGIESSGLDSTAGG